MIQCIEYKCDKCGYGYVKAGQENADMFKDFTCANSVFGCEGKLEPVLIKKPY